MRNCLLLGSVLLIVGLGVGAQEMPDPPAPIVKIPHPGTGVAAYWVVAENAAGQRTAAGAPAVVRDLPDPAGEGGAVTIAVTPVANAVRYFVLKTTPMDVAPKITATAAAPGDRTVYYWLQWHNGWRRSGLTGPLAVQGAEPKGNVVEWEKLANATFYHVFRTATPEPPVGRGFWVVGQQVGVDKRWPWGSAGPCRITDRGPLTELAVGYPATLFTEPPVGAGLFVVGETDGTGVVEDLGEPLRLLSVPNSNLSREIPVAGPAAEKSDITRRLGAQVWVAGNNDLEHTNVPSFAGGHAETMVVWNHMNSGGHSEYHGGAQGSKGWKSWVAAIAARTTSHTASQHGALTSALESYGSGDAIALGLDLHNYGTNNDDGDEGCYLERNHSIRRLSAWESKLAANAARGTRRLHLGDYIGFNDAGAERLVVNLSQTYAAGRIARVGNVDVHGKGTEWTPAMVGHYISFDVDTTVPEGGKYSSDKAHRMWYWITAVTSPTELTILAKTGWSTACNLGYSRFIWDPETMKGSQPANTSTAAMRYLPPERAEAARAGGYLMAPGVRLGDPWKDRQDLNVEPLTEDWHAGDTIRIVAGPQTYQAIARHIVEGDYLAQDQVGGMAIGNRGNRITNFPALSIGNPGWHGFREGIQICLDRSGYGDGLVIDAATGWDADGHPAGNGGVHRAAIVVPENLTAITGEHDWKVPAIRWQLPKDGTGALQVTRKNGDVLASVDQQGTTTVRQLAVAGNLEVGGLIDGNDGTRGKAVFDGDGKQTRFRIKLAAATGADAVVLFNTNQFARSRLVTVNPASFDIEFEEAPAAGTANVTVWWMAQR